MTVNITLMLVQCSEYINHDYDYYEKCPDYQALMTCMDMWDDVLRVLCMSMRYFYEVLVPEVRGISYEVCI